MKTERIFPYDLKPEEEGKAFEAFRDNGIMILENYCREEVAIERTNGTEHYVDMPSETDGWAPMIHMKGTYDKNREIKLAATDDNYDFETYALMALMKSCGKEKSWDAFKRIFKGEIFK